MIIVKNRELLIPEHERYIGTPIDNYADNRIFKIKRFSQSGEDLSGLTFRLDLKYPTERTVYTFARSTTHTGGSVSVLSKTFVKAYPNAGTYTFSFNGTEWKRSSNAVDLEEIGVVINFTPVSGDTITIVSTISNVSGNVVLLEKEIGDNEINLIWHITENDTAIPGTVFVALRGSDGDATVRYASYYAALYVDANLDQTVLPASGITELEQLENMTAEQLRKMEYLYNRYKDLDVAAQDAEAWAKGTRNGYPVPAGDDTYQNNAKYYSDLREEATHLAEAWARGTRDGVDLPAGQLGYHDNSKWWKDLSESWAVGGTGVRAGENTDNSRYYADQSRIEGNGLASIFSDAVNYTAGDYVIYEGILYLFDEGHASGPWTGTDAERVNLADGVTDARKRKVLKFNTCVDMKASTDLLTGMLCQTAGYYSVNDGGAALYYIMGAAPADDYYETLQNGLIGVLVANDTVTPEMFGAYGDGTHDDTSAIAKALNCGAKVNFRQKVYCVSGRMAGTAEIVCGNGAVIKITAVSTNSVFVLTNVKKVSGFEFNCNNIGSNGMLSVTNPDNHVEVSDIYIHDFNDTSSSYGSTLINVQHVKSAHVHDIRFKNCKKRGNGVVMDTGAFKGVSVTDYAEDSEINAVSSYNFNIVDASGTPIVDDADTIYVASASETACALIHDLYGYNPGRRLIKSQCKHIIVDSVYCYTNATDSVALIGIQTYIGSDNIEKPPIGIVSNCIMVNDNTYNNTARYLIAVSGAVSINNCKLISPNHYAINNNGEMVVSDCTIEGYGVMDAGKSLKLNNCVFSGHSFIFEPDNNEIEKIIISNCDVNDIGAGQIGYSFFDHKYGEVEISNSRYDGAVYFKSTGNNIMKDCVCHCRTIDMVYVLSAGQATIKNCKYYFTGTQSGISRPIRVDSGCAADIDNIEAVDFAYHAIANGTIRSKNTDPWKIWVNDGTLDAQPVFVNALPTLTNATRLQDGIKVILTTDGKMYSKSGSAWTAVN